MVFALALVFGSLATLLGVTGIFFLWHNVAYPFVIGVGSGCSIDESFDLTCNTTYDPPKLFTLVQSFDLRLFCLDCFLM
ncbi:hypothetical protein HanPI659440_Chr13g0500501 [Helianthus annuus]|nr:hypothetical protein HanPI659440_Chr13g0500501 [Helianthus annuus]